MNRIFTGSRNTCAQVLFADDYRPWVIVIIVSRSILCYGYLASGIDAAANVRDSLFVG